MKKYEPLDFVLSTFSDLKKLFTFFSTVLPVLLITITIVIIIIPVMILAIAFSFLFKPKVMGIDLSIYKDDFKQVIRIDKDLGLENDQYVFANKTNTSIRSLIECGLTLQKDSANCFSLVNRETGLFNLTGQSRHEDAKFAEVFEEPADKIHLGQVELDAFREIHIPGIYNVVKLIPKYKDSSEARKQDEKLQYDEEFVKQVFGTCEVDQNHKCYEVRPGKQNYAFSAFSSTNLARYYGFDTADTGIVFRDYQLYSGDPYSSTNGILRIENNQELILYPEHTDDFKIIYHGNFSPFFTDQDYVVQHVPIASSNDPFFKVSVEYKGKTVNPAMLYLASKYTFGIHDTGSKGVYVHKKVVSKQAAYDEELLSKLNFIQPMDQIIITQLAKVPGVSDGGKTIHGAIDFIPAGVAADIKASISGVVVESAYDDWSGNYITIEDPLTKIHVNYCHMVSPSSFKVGDTVQQGEVVGIMGNTGKSFGAHVHMQVSLLMENGEYGWIDFIDLLDNYVIQGQYNLP